MRIYEFEEALFHLQYNSHKDCSRKTPKPERVEADARSEHFIRCAGLWSKYQEWYRSRSWYDRRMKIETVKNDKDSYWIILSTPRDHIVWGGHDLMEQPLYALHACRRRDEARMYGKEFKVQIIDAIIDSHQSKTAEQKKEEESC